jgi:hypothetical protein
MAWIYITTIIRRKARKKATEEFELKKHTKQFAGVLYKQKFVIPSAARDLLFTFVARRTILTATPFLPSAFRCHPDRAAAAFAAATRDPNPAQP